MSTLLFSLSELHSLGQNLSIVVSNAQPDLLDWVEAQKAANGDRLYVASKPEAYGILQGLRKFGFY